MGGYVFEVKKSMVGSKYPYFCNCCIPSVLLKDRHLKFYHLHIMPKLSVSKKLKRSVDDLETPVRVSKPVAVQNYLYVYCNCIYIM